MHDQAFALLACMQIGHAGLSPAGPIFRIYTDSAIEAETAFAAALAQFRRSNVIAAPQAQLWSAGVAEVLALHSRLRNMITDIAGELQAA